MSIDKLWDKITSCYRLLPCKIAVLESSICCLKSGGKTSGDSCARLHGNQLDWIVSNQIQLEPNKAPNRLVLVNWLVFVGTNIANTRAAPSTCRLVKLETNNDNNTNKKYTCVFGYEEGAQAAHHYTWMYLAHKYNRYYMLAIDHLSQSVIFIGIEPGYDCYHQLFQFKTLLYWHSLTITNNDDITTWLQYSKESHKSFLVSPAIEINEIIFFKL